MNEILIRMAVDGIFLAAAVSIGYIAIWRKIRPAYNSSSSNPTRSHPPHYDKLIEFAMKMNQVIALCWLAIEQERKIDPHSALKLWQMPFIIIYRGRRMETSLSNLIQEYSMFLPSRICEMCMEIDRRAKKGQFEQAQEKVFDVYEWFQMILGVNQNRREMRKILMMISRNNEEHAGAFHS